MNLAQEQVLEQVLSSLNILAANLERPPIHASHKRIEAIRDGVKQVCKYTPRLQEGGGDAPAVIPLGEAFVGAKWLVSFFCPGLPPMVVTFQESGDKLVKRVARLREVYAEYNNIKPAAVAIRQAKIVGPKTRKK